MFNCKKNAIKISNDYVLYYKGKLNSFEKGEQEKYYNEKENLNLICTESKINQLDFSHISFTRKNRFDKFESTFFDTRPSGTSQANYTFKYEITNCDYKYKWSKFKYMLEGNIVVSKKELKNNLPEWNDSYLVGTFTLQPKEWKIK